MMGIDSRLLPPKRNHVVRSPELLSALIVLAITAGCAGGPQVGHPPGPELVAARTPPPPFRSPTPSMAPRRKEEVEDTSGWAKQGFLFGGEVVAGVDVGGDFDGNTVIVDPNDNLTLLPKVDNGSGLGVKIGYRFRKRAVELGFQRVQHDGEFQGLDTDLEMSYLNLHIKEYFFVETPFQPFLMLGVSSLWGKISNGAVNSGGTVIKDARLTGHSGDLGAGFALVPHPRIHIDASGIYKIADFTASGGITDDLPIRGDVDVSGWVFALGVTFTL